MTDKKDKPWLAGKAPPPQKNPMEALTLNTPSLAAVKASLPVFSAFADDEEAKRRKAAHGPQVGDAALAHAENKREGQRTAARRNARNKRSTQRGDLGYIDSVAESRRVADLDAGAVDISPAAIAANLAELSSVIDKRAAWTPLSAAAAASAPAAAAAGASKPAVPAGRRPGSGSGWQPWTDKGGGQEGAGFNSSNGGRAVGLRRPESAAPRTRPRLTEGLEGLKGRPGMPTPTISSVLKPGGDDAGGGGGGGGGSSAAGARKARPSSAAVSRSASQPALAAAGGAGGAGAAAAAAAAKPAMPVDKNLVNASFTTGYSYSTQLMPGSMFFAAIEAVAKDNAANNLPPLQLRIPPTIVLGLSAIGGGDAASDPLWIWSDVGKGGGVRVMRAPITSAQAALDFLAGAACVAAVADIPEKVDAPSDAPAAAPATSEEAREVEVTDADGHAAGGDRAAEMRSHRSHVAEVAAQRKAAQDEARETLLDAVCCVLKTFSEVRGGMQQVQLMSVRRLAKNLDGLQKGDTRPLAADGSGGGTPGTPASVCLFQRYVHPPVSRASITRVQHRHVIGYEPRPLRGFQLDAPHQMPRPQPTGLGLQQQEAVETMISSSGTPGAVAQQIHCRGDHWADITAAIRQLTSDLKRVLNWHFEELVVELILIPAMRIDLGGSPWWLTQVKAFKATKLDDVGPEKRAARFKPTVDRPHILQCVGDYCIGKEHNVPSGGAERRGGGGVDEGEGLQSSADLGGAAAGASRTSADELDPNATAATRRIPYRWLVFDRLNASVKHRVDDGFDVNPSGPLGGSSDSAQLHGLGVLVHEDQPGVQYGGKDVRRNTIGSSSRAASLRRLYTPASVRRGRPLVCVSAARLYDEVPVCHECYQVYSSMADDWKKKPTALLSVASAPALGLIGAPISELPSELLGHSAALTEFTNAALATGAKAAAAAAAAGEKSGLVTPAATPTTPAGGKSLGAAANDSAGATPAGAGVATPGVASTAGSTAQARSTPKKNERSHALHNLLQNTNAATSDSPFALAKRYAFLNHCLACNVLCKACVLHSEDDKKRMDEIANKSRPDSPGKRLGKGFGMASSSSAYALKQRKLAMAIQKGEEVMGYAAPAPTVAQNAWRRGKEESVQDYRRNKHEQERLNAPVL